MWARPAQPSGADRFDAWLNRILVRAITDEARKRRGFVANVVQLTYEPSVPDSSGALADRDEIARVFDEELGTPGAQLDLVRFLDGRAGSGTAVEAGADAFRQSWRRSKWVTDIKRVEAP